MIVELEYSVIETVINLCTFSFHPSWTGSHVHLHWRLRLEAKSELLCSFIG